MSNILDDLAMTTQIQQKILKAIFNRVESCIAHNVIESYLSGNNQGEIDLSFCKLVYTIDNGELQFNFIPSKSLERKIKSNLENNEDFLLEELKDKVNESINNVYEALL